MMILVTLPALLYGLVRLGLTWRVTEKRAHYLFAIGVVVAASAVVGAVHFYRHVSTRQEADRVVLQLLDFWEKQGRFPKDKSELDGAALRDGSKPTLPHIYYRLPSDDKPILLYSHTFFAFALYQYDFSSQTWSLGFE